MSVLSLLFGGCEMNLMEKYLLKIRPKKIDVYEKLSDLTEDELESYEERAAIMEFNGNMPRKEAEQKALDRILEKRRPWLN